MKTNCVCWFHRNLRRLCLTGALLVHALEPIIHVPHGIENSLVALAGALPTYE